MQFLLDLDENAQTNRADGIYLGLFRVIDKFEGNTSPPIDMEISLDFITLIHLTAIVLGLVSTAVILYFGIRTNPANQPLAIAQLSMTLGCFVSFSLVSGLMVHWPFMYRLGNAFWLVFISMSYLYTVFNTRKRLWKWYDLMHVIPVLIYLVDYWDVLSLSSAEKTRLILQDINNLDLVGQFRESKYFGPGFHQKFRTVLFSVYWVAQAVILSRWVRSHTTLTPQNKVWRNWMLIFLGCQIFMWFPYFLSLLGMPIPSSYSIVYSLTVLWLMISSLSLFFFPSLLYGSGLAVHGVPSRTARTLRKPEASDVEDKKLEEVMQKIESHMYDKKLFLTTGYSINDFSNDIHIPVYQISKSLIRFKGFGFVDFINQQRIRYCVAKFDQGEWLNFTLEAVALECGFSNRNSFTKSFKKFKDCSPSEYREQSRI
jgi:AraC-like DNA-binding protein